MKQSLLVILLGRGLMNTYLVDLFANEKAENSHHINFIASTTTIKTTIASHFRETKKRLVTFLSVCVQRTLPAFALNVRTTYLIQTIRIANQTTVSASLAVNKRTILYLS